MKKEYIIPEIEIVSSQLEQAMMGFSDDWADAKEQTTIEEDEFFSEKEETTFGELSSPSIWDDEKE